MNFVKYKIIAFIFTGVLAAGSISALAVFGLKLGIDFTGGAIMEIEYKNTRPSNQEIEEKLKEFNLGSISVQPTGEKGVLIRMRDIPNEVHQQILEKLGSIQSEIEEKRFESIGPVIGKELAEKTKLVIVLTLLAIVVYVALAFRKVQRPVKSWQYGLASLISLFHDALIPLAVFSVLGKFYNVEITIPVITALLTVLGYSINNVVVVFDRIRENILKKNLPFDELVNASIHQTLARQINTALTTLLALAAIFIFGGESLKYFSLTLIIGIITGAYSSIFLAGPLLAAWQNFRMKKGR